MSVVEDLKAFVYEYAAVEKRERMVCLLSSRNGVARFASELDMPHKWLEMARATRLTHFIVLGAESLSAMVNSILKAGFSNKGLFLTVDGDILEGELLCLYSRCYGRTGMLLFSGKNGALINSDYGTYCCGFLPPADNRPSKQQRRTK